MLKEIELPKYLFKYCKLDQHFFDMIKNKKLWFSAPSDFNDPFDCNVSWNDDYSEDDVEDFVRNTAAKHNSEDVIQEQIKKYKSDPTLIQASIDQLGGFVHTLRVSCFSANPGNVTMWAHYADSHKGACLTFNAMELIKRFRSIYPVEYVNDFPKVSFIKNHNEAVNRIISTKSTHWAYEKEYRIINDNKGLVPFPQQAFHQICFGLRTPEPEIIKTIRFMKDCGYRPSTDWLFFRVQMDEKSYNFKYVQCNA